MLNRAVVLVAALAALACGGCTTAGTGSQPDASSPVTSAAPVPGQIQDPAPNQDQGTANPIFSRYAGTWTTTGGKLEIRDDYTGTETIELGFGCGGPTAPCREVDDLSFTNGPNNSLNATVTNVTIPDNYVATYHVRDTFNLSLPKENVLHFTWSDNKERGASDWVQ